MKTIRTSKRLTLFFMLTAFCLAVPIQGQVTIGSGVEPAKAALLDIKDQASDAQGVTATKGGLLLPRVNLLAVNLLAPFIPVGSDDWTDLTKRTAIKKNHIGLMVYNLNVKYPLIKGPYVWAGEEWVMAKVMAQNGLEDVDGYVQLGGELIEDSTVITLDNDKVADQKFIINLKNMPEAPVEPSTTDPDYNTKYPEFLNDLEEYRKSGMVIRGLKSQPNSLAVVADMESGKLGVAASMPAHLAFIQSGVETLNPPAINTPNVGMWVVPWTQQDVNRGTNSGFVELKSNSTDGSYFEIKIDAMVEISGMVGYIGGGTSDAIIINSTLQIKRNGQNWEDYSSVRGVYVNTTSYYRNTLNIPPALVQLEAGDGIRMILARAAGNGQNGFLGVNHSTSDGGIVKPYGTQFSKMIKMIVQ